MLSQAIEEAKADSSAGPTPTVQTEAAYQGL